MPPRPDIESSMLGLLARRAPDASICPSEVARTLEPRAWRALMPAVRDVAARLAAAGVVRVTQGAKELAPGQAAVAIGPIRLRRGACFPVGGTGGDGKASA